MIVGDQNSILEELLKPDAYDASENVVSVSKITSHVSAVFLAGDKAYKVKMAVKFPYLDYSTPEKRKKMCEREFELLKEFSPEIAIGIFPIYRDESGKIKVSKTQTPPEGEILDYALVMHQFPQEAIFENQATEGKLDRFEMMDLAELVAEKHKNAKPVVEIDGTQMIKGRILENDEILKCFVPEVFDYEDVEELTALSLEELEDVSSILDERTINGKIKRCHGDLHFHNIFMDENGKPALFDPIEFNDKLVEIDTLYDLAFLLMDMEKKGYRRLISIFFNHYISYSGNISGVPTLPLLQSIRAAIRAQVCATMAMMKANNKEANILRQEAYEYIQLAKNLLTPPAPMIVASGGLSGTGKSRLSRELAPYIGNSPGAIILRTDIIRKSLVGKLPHEKLHSEDYGPELSKKTYEALRQECAKIISAGQTVLADGIFARQEEREEIEKIAKELGVEFQGFWMTAPSDVRFDRVAKRLRNPSDATVKVAMRQEELDVGEVTWHQIDSSGAREETIIKARRVLGV